MSSQPKDIVDRLSYLKQMLNEQKENPRNKTKRINQYYQFFNNNKLKTQRNTQTKNNNELNNDEFSHDQTEIIYQDIEEEEEEEEDENEQNYSYDNENQTEYNENTEYISQFESNEIIAPIPKFTKIKSDAKTFAKLTFFRRWRRAFQAKRIQITISNKMKKYKQKDGDKENGIYKPCYDPFSFKKATKTEQLESIERLSKPRNKINNHIPPHSNPQYTPKTDKEKKNGQRRHLVRQIAIERDENEQKTKPVTQKEMDKIIRRLLLPKKTTEKVPENPRPTISQKKQFENALRLSVPKKKEDKNDDDENQLKTNRFILPTKKEQLEICTRLSQPKPDFSPKPIKQKPTITQAEQMEICERLSGIKKENLKKKKIEIKEEDVFKKKAHKKSKKKGRKNRKKKNRQIQNDESLTFLSNKQVVLPTASPVPTQNLPASPLNINTPRKVRFNGFQSPKEKLEKFSRILSKEVDEAIGEITENNSISSTQLQNKTQQEFSSTQLSDDDFQQNQNSIQISPLFKVTPTPKIERQKKPQRAGRRASYTPTRYQQYQKEDQNLAKDDTDVNQKYTKRNVYHTLAGYRRKSIQENTHFPSSDDGERYSHEAIRSSEDEQNQNKDSIIMDDKNESEIHISNIDSKEEIILSSQNPEKDDQKEEEETNKNELVIIEEEEEVDETEIKINQEEEEEKQTNSSKVEIIINKEEDDELFDEEEEDQLQSHSTSLLKSSENENDDDDDEFNQDKFYFESPRSNEFQFEEELNEKRNHIIDDDDDEIVHDSSKLASKGQRSFSSEIESETIKEIDKTDLDQFVKDNLLIINEEEEDENDEVVINDNISGIEAHTPINGLISNSGFEINLLSNTQDSS